MTEPVFNGRHCDPKCPFLTGGVRTEPEVITGRYGRYTKCVYYWQMPEELMHTQDRFEPLRTQRCIKKEKT